MTLQHMLLLQKHLIFIAFKPQPWIMLSLNILLSCAALWGRFRGGTIAKECMVFHGFTLISAVMCARESRCGSTYTLLCVYLRVTPGHISVSEPSRTPAHSWSRRTVFWGLVQIYRAKIWRSNVFNYLSGLSWCHQKERKNRMRLR